MPWMRDEMAKEALFDGMAARRLDQQMGTNPHQPGTRSHRAWDDGWRIEDALIRRTKARAA